VAIVFANANSGEAYITVDGNAGDRNNLTLWGNGDALIAHVASINPNTVVVLHTVGPVIVEAFKNHPNITALLWAGLPGQESGNAITDVLYGKINPQAKSIFTWGKRREDWGVDVIYTPTSDPPQLNFKEGNFIDYRYFDANKIDPSYEFGFGLSYTTFSYSDLRIQKQNPGPYQPTTGKTSAAPTFGKIDYDPSHAEFPAGFHAVKNYVYPYLDGPIPQNQTQNWPKGAFDSSPQPKLPAGGSSGGNRQLWDVMYIVSATVTNTGKVKGTEVVQLVSLFTWCFGVLFISRPVIRVFRYNLISEVHVLERKALIMYSTVHLVGWTHGSQTCPSRLRRSGSFSRREPKIYVWGYKEGYIKLGRGQSELGG